MRLGTRYDRIRFGNETIAMQLESKPALGLAVAGALIALCVVARLLPHPPNFAPLAAVALVGCLFFARQWQVGLVVVLGMGIGDLLLGFYDIGVMLTVYASLLMPLAARRFIGRSPTALRIGAAAVGAGIGFYLTTNAAVWFFGSSYPPTAEGLLASYAAGLPFLKWTLAGNLFWSAVLFGAFRFGARAYPPASLASGRTLTA